MSGGSLDIDDPNDVVDYANRYSTVVTGFCDSTSTAVSGIGVPGGSSPVDRVGAQALSWATGAIGAHARAVVQPVRTATQGVVTGARAIATTDTESGGRLRTQVVT